MRLNEFIQHLEEKEISLKLYKDKLLNTAKSNNENVDIQQILSTLSKIDPTKNKNYLEWLCKQYLNKLFRLEDATRVNSALSNFDKIKHKLEVSKRDINKYTLHSLEVAMDEIFNPTVGNDDFDVSGSDVEVKYKGPLGTLAIPMTQEASCRLGSSTKWCTAADKDNYFDFYNNQAPLYIWKDSTGKYQFYFGNDMQFKDARDRDISPDQLNKFRTKHPVLSKLFKEKEAEIMKDAGTACTYAEDVIQSRWPEAEPYIMKDAYVAYLYAKSVIQSRWPEAEPYIMKDENAAYLYAKTVIQSRWPDAEPYIMKDADIARWYARDVIKGEWPEAEPYIMKDENVALWYAKYILKDPNPNTWAERYKKAHNLRLNEFIQHLEEKEISLKLYKDKLLNTAKSNNENVDIQQILSTLNKIDPTKNKNYTEWLCKQYINKQFRLEDATRINDVLTNFDKIKHKLEVSKRDINKYTLHSLEVAMDEIFNPTVENDNFNVNGLDVEVKYKGPLGTLAIPLTQEASCRLGSGTKWCTAADKNNYFDFYNDQAPLYIWKDSTGKYQFYFGSGMQFKDARDRDISPDLLNKFRTEHPVLSNLFKEKEAEIMKNAQLAIWYAMGVLKRRWPEAEPYIMKDAYVAYLYAKAVIQSRWPEAEPIIIKDAMAACDYAEDVLKSRWPEAEPIIIKDAYVAYLYAKAVIQSRWPEAEHIIASDYIAAKNYAKDVLKDPSPETWAERYKKEHNLRLNEFIQYLTEYKRDITQQKLGDRLLNAAKSNNENVDIQQILATLEQIDPTKHKQYVEWLCKQYINKLFRLEDAGRVNSALSNFDKIKNKLEVQKRDINKYTLHSLEVAMDEIFNPEVKANNDFNVSGSDVEVKYKGPLGTLAIPLTQEASCRLGSGTKWCTAAAADEDNYFDVYNSKETPLYIWKDGTGKYQFYFGDSSIDGIESRQFKDARDRDISPELINKFRTEHPVLSNLFKEKEADIMENPYSAFRYAQDVLKRRWPEAEPYIMKNRFELIRYLQEFFTNKRWPEAEPYIMKYPANAVYYAVEHMKERWPEAEQYIAKDPKQATEYAKEFLLDEESPVIYSAIAKDLDCSMDFARALGDPEYYTWGKRYLSKLKKEMESNWSKNVK